MPGVDFNAVQTLVSMSQVLEFIGFVASSTSGSQLHGPCPVHRSESARSRVFSVNLSQNVCYCHKCGYKGKQIQLWAKVNDIGIYEAAVDLCRRVNVDVPWDDANMGIRPV